MRHDDGFTLIELMITVVIVAILASVAYPAYTDYVLRGKIQEGTTNLLSMRTKLEQYFQDARTFVGACAAGTVAPLPVNQKYFTITCPVLSATQYTVQASGEGFTFTINEANVRATTAVHPGWTLPATNCWVTKKGGVC